MKILSIDFDFFQNITKKSLDYYPDGVDTPPEISDIIWKLHYEQYADKLNKITINKTFYKQLLTIIRKQKSHIPIMIVNSHKHAYDFIVEHAGSEPIELYNIDLHHDIMNPNPELDCGNWIKHIMQDTNVTKFRWIARKISKTCYDLDEDFIKTLYIEFDFKSIKDMQFDAIFLCRSNPWTPPHLDYYFDNLVNTFMLQFDTIKIEQCVTKPRICHLT